MLSKLIYPQRKKMIVTVVKTNIDMPQEAIKIVNEINKGFIVSKVTIDLEDEDRVLRLEHSDLLDVNKVLRCIRENGFSCQELLD